MPDEELQPQAENEQPEPQPTVEPSPAQEDQVAAQEEVQETAPESSDKPNRAQRRISDLSKQLKEAQAERARLEAESQARDFFNQQPGTSDPWEQYQNGEITMDQLKTVVQQTASSSAEFAAQKEAAKLRAELAEKEFWANTEKDVRELESSNPVFNPSSPEFDAEYVDELSQLYTEAYGKDVQSLQRAPKLSTFVSRIEKLRKKAEEQGVVRSSAQLAEQAAQGAVIGTGGAVQSKGNSRDALIQKGKQTGDFKDFFKTMAGE
jgi:hypothetical protein